MTLVDFENDFTLRVAFFNPCMRLCGTLEREAVGKRDLQLALIDKACALLKDARLSKGRAMIANRPDLHAMQNVQYQSPMLNSQERRSA